MVEYKKNKNGVRKKVVRTGNNWRPPDVPTEVSLSKLAARNIPRATTFKSTSDYKLALARERLRLKNQYTNTELAEKTAKILSEPTYAGRPTQYRKEFEQIARVICSVYGSTPLELAKFFKVNPFTIVSWIKEYPEFDRAVNDRSTDMNVQIMGRLARRALGFYAKTEKIFYDVKRGDVVKVPTKEYYPPSETAIMFWLKNRMPEHWKDTKDVNVEENKKLVLEIYKNFETMTAEQASDAYQELLKVESSGSQENRSQRIKDNVTDVVDEGSTPGSRSSGNGSKSS